MNKGALYLGVFAVNPKESLKNAKYICQETIREASEEAPQNPIVQGDLVNFNQIFSPPRDALHVTTLFLGKGRKGKIDFEPNIKLKVNSRCIVYVPGHLLCAFTPQVGIKAENSFPHVTLLLGPATKAVESNSVLQTLFAAVPGLAVEPKKGWYPVQYGPSKQIYVSLIPFALDGISGDNVACG